MKVITAPEPLRDSLRGCRSVFLAGGITGCSDWQKKVITELHRVLTDEFDNTYSICVLNPRRDDFDVLNPNATYEQIKWEHRVLEKCDIFSIFFEASDSIQPISLYELGKYSRTRPSVITVQKGYKREQDVIVQTALDNMFAASIEGDNAIEYHARAIAAMLQKIDRRC